MKQFLISALTTLLSLTSFGSGSEKFLVKEGFSSQTPSENLRTAWENTLLFEYIKVGNSNGSALAYGSTSVVFKEKKGDGIYLGLITNKHVHRPIPEYQLFLYKNIVQYNADIMPVTKSSEKIKSAQYVSSALSNDFDLAFVVVKISSEDAQAVRELHFPQSCELAQGTPLVAIGFPRTIFRVPDPSNTSDELVWRMKRWSSGVYVGDTKQVRGPTYGTTIDAINGNSGGPVVNSHGNLVGVMTAVTGPRYNASEDPQDYKSFSYIVNCQAAKDFAQKSWQEFLQNQPSEI